MSAEKKIILGFSPCPNDTFIFDALVNGKIDTGPFRFEYFLTDVEELNNRAFSDYADVTKLSFHAFLFLCKKYFLLDSGSALGRGCGPLLICREGFDLKKNPDPKIAVPGQYTTANLLLSLMFPDWLQKKHMLFSEIEDAVLDGSADAGVIIHENRFTYQAKGLKKLADMGQWWENLTSGPIPLGGIVVRSEFLLETRVAINRLVRESVQYAFANPLESMEFVMANSQITDEEIVKQHIELYVNDFSVSLGNEGRNAVIRLFEIANERGLISEIPSGIFSDK